MFKKYDAYKNSYIQGIKLIPEKWKVMKLKYLLDSKAGFAFPSDAFSDSGTAVVRISDLLVSGVVDISKSPKLPSKFNKYLSEYFAEEGNILMAMTGGTIGKVSIYKYEQKSFLNQRVCKFIPKANFYPKLAWYWMNTDVWKDYIDLKAFGGAQPNISDNTIKEMQICLPDSLDTQISICNFLDEKTYEIEQVIAIKEQQIALLNERKQIVIQKAVTQGLDPNVPMKDSGVDGIGQIPKHWETYFNRRLFRENSRPVRGDELPLSLSQKDGVIPSGEMKEKSLSPAHRNNFKLCFPNDLVVNRFKGHLGVFFQSNYTGIVTFHYGVFEPAKNVYTKYFELLYHTEQYKTLYAGASNGMSIGLQNLSNLNFYRIKSIVPPLEEQKLICEYADKVENEHNNLIHKLKSQIEKLKEYKTTLINDAVTGKIKVA